MRFFVRDIRWWLFKQLISLSWWICPEPAKTALKVLWLDAIDNVCKELKKP